MVSCRDPGLMERVTDEEAGRGGWYWNEQVGSFRPPGALYCRECGVSERLFQVKLERSPIILENLMSYLGQVLIEGYDHLCPWTGTGIGHGNMMAFKAFVVGVNVLCYFSIGLVAYILLRGLVTGT
jgi:DHHC palmitoyltransferase